MPACYIIFKMSKLEVICGPMFAMGILTNMGKKNLTEEQRERIRAANRRRIWSETSKQKLRDANKGKRASEETKTKMSRTRKGVSKTLETRQKMSATGRQYDLECNKRRREATSRNNTLRNVLGKDFNVKGYYIAKKCAKGKVPYRSASIELRLMEQFDADPLVVSWESPLIIRYHGTDGTTFHALPDFLIWYSDGTKMVIEGKGPHLIGRYLNGDKYRAVKEWCSQNNIGYRLVTSKNRCTELEIVCE